MVTYSPILRWKQGEWTGLSHLSTQGRAGVTPLIVPLGAKFSGGTPAADFAARVETCWGTARVYIDAADLPGTLQHHSLDDIRAEAANLHLVPAINGNFAPPEYLNAVQRMEAADGRGVALRISLANMTSAPTWVANWPYPVGQTDLIIDLASSVANVLALGNPVVAAFQALHMGAQWRSVTMAGGSIPADLTGYAVGTTTLDRAELRLWQAVSGAQLPYVLHYGDYATIGPDASMGDIGGPVPINAKYTQAASFFIRHGVRPSGPGGVDRAIQYRGHAQAVLASAGYAPLQHCWGDGMIAGVATNPAASPGSPTSWVSFAVNRHIEFTRTQLP